MIYLLHSTAPLGGSGASSARHYLGWCRDGHLVERLARHRRPSNQTHLTRAYTAAGGKLLLVNTLARATREDEVRLKRSGHLAEYCVLCRPGLVPGEGWPKWLLTSIRGR